MFLLAPMRPLRLHARQVLRRVRLLPRDLPAGGPVPRRPLVMPEEGEPLDKSYRAGALRSPGPSIRKEERMARDFEREIYLEGFRKVNKYTDGSVVAFE